MEARRFSVRDVAVVLGVAAVLAFFLFPIYWMIATSLKHPPDILTQPPKWIFEPTLDNYRFVFQRRNFVQYFQNSLFAATFSSMIVVLLGGFTAYGIARYRVGRGPLMFFILTFRMFPPIAVVIPFFIIFRTFHLLDTRLALVIAYTVMNLPLAVWLMHSFVRDIPLAVEEAAYVDGYTRWQVLGRVVAPLAAPGLAVTFIFSFLFAWNEFLFAFILTRTQAATVTLGVSSFITQEGTLWGPLAASAVVAVLPMMVLVMFLQRYVARGLTFGAVKG
jgi:multiple sugar transport system permease protein